MSWKSLLETLWKCTFIQGVTQHYAMQYMFEWTVVYRDGEIKTVGEEWSPHKRENFNAIKGALTARHFAEYVLSNEISYLLAWVSSQHKFSNISNNGIFYTAIWFKQCNLNDSELYTTSYAAI